MEYLKPYDRATENVARWLPVMIPIFMSCSPSVTTVAGSTPVRAVRLGRTGPVYSGFRGSPCGTILRGEIGAQRALGRGFPWDADPGEWNVRFVTRRG